MQMHKIWSDSSLVFQYHVSRRVTFIHSKLYQCYYTHSWPHDSIHILSFFFFFPTSHGIMQEIIGFSWYQFLIQYKELWNRCQYSEIICYVHNKSSKFLLCLWNSLAEYILLSTIWVSQNEYFLTTHCSPSLWGDSRWCDYIFTMR